MIRSRQHRRTEDSRGKARRTLAGLAFIVALAVIPPGFSLAAGWLAPASDQAVTAPWVKDIAAQLKEEPYCDMLANSPGEPPNPAVVRYLNNTAQATQPSKNLLVQSYIDRALGVFDSGVQRGYYSRSDVEPVKQLIRGKAGASMKGEKTTAAQEQERWTG